MRLVPLALAIFAAGCAVEQQDPATMQLYGKAQSCRVTAEAMGQISAEAGTPEGEQMVASATELRSDAIATVIETAKALGYGKERVDADAKAAAIAHNETYSANPCPDCAARLMAEFTACESTIWRGTAGQ